VKFLNLVYAISLQRKRHYEIAQAAGISEWRLSRLLNGRNEFTPAERRRIADALGFDEGWLFETPKPPKPRIFDGETTPAMA
jgi:transcriptional regulator with XRE-family HTH domain